jgi:hypothetical protein
MIGKRLEKNNNNQTAATPKNPWQKMNDVTSRTGLMRTLFLRFGCAVQSHFKHVLCLNS